MAKFTSIIRFTGSLGSPQTWKTDEVELWISFHSENGKKNSDSVYVQVA